MRNKQRTESKKGLVKKLRQLLREQKDFDLTHFGMVLRLKKILKGED